MFNSDMPSGFNQTGWNMPEGYNWLMLKLYILCLEHKIDTSIIQPEIKDGELHIQVNGLVPTDFLVLVHNIEYQSIYMCNKCGMNGMYRPSLGGTYCLYHYIEIKIKKLWNRILLNYK